MAVFSSKKFRPPPTKAGNIAAWYRRQLIRSPFLSFGLPFIVTMVAGSFVLTPATALRFERHDRKVQQLRKEDELGLGKDRHRVDIQEDYYRLAAKVSGLYIRVKVKMVEM